MISSNASESYISNENDVDNGVVVDVVAPAEKEFPATFDKVSFEYISKYASIEHNWLIVSMGVSPEYNCMSKLNFISFDISCVGFILQSSNVSFQSFLIESYKLYRKVDA